MSIERNCLSLNLQIGTWLGYRLDKVTTKKVTNEAGASDDAARVNKHLIPKESLAHVTTAVGKVRLHFYEHTLPWRDNGDRLLPRAAYMQFYEDHAKLKDEHDEAVDDFLTNRYLAAQEQAEFRMGDLFNPDDYPTAEALRPKFYVNLDVEGIAKSMDFRLNNDASILQGRVTKAMQALWLRLAEPLEHFAHKMGSDEIFRDSAVNNLREIVSLIPTLNFTGDQDLEKVREEIEAKLTAWDPKDLRKDKGLRSGVAHDAQNIIDQMRSLMGAFGNGEDA